MIYKVQGQFFRCFITARNKNTGFLSQVDRESRVFDVVGGGEDLRSSLDRFFGIVNLGLPVFLGDTKSAKADNKTAAQLLRNLAYLGFFGRWIYDTHEFNKYCSLYKEAASRGADRHWPQLQYGQYIFGRI